MEVLLTDREMSRGELSRAVLMVETRHPVFVFVLRCMLYIQVVVSNRYLAIRFYRP